MTKLNADFIADSIGEAGVGGIKPPPRISAHLQTAAPACPPWALACEPDSQHGWVLIVPVPWSAPLRLPYSTLSTLPSPSQSPQALCSLAVAQAEGKPQVRSFDLLVDAIGLLAQLTLKPNHQQVFRYIPAGRFLMGTPPSEAGRKDNEHPQHQVTLQQGFWLADTACAQGFWKAVMGKNPSHFTPSYLGSLAHPVEGVSWSMIQPFLQKLEAILPGCQVTLPTEAEWEYACRAGTQTPFSCGDFITSAQANYNGLQPYHNGSTRGMPGENRACTVAVTALPANAWGLYQTHGNVWEWCADPVRAYGEAAVDDPGLDDALAPAQTATAQRALRGGGWASNAKETRSAYRNCRAPNWKLGGAGFRFVVRCKDGGE